MISIALPRLEAEAAAFLRVQASAQLTQWEQVVTFERRFAEVYQVQEAIAVSSRMGALLLAFTGARSMCR